jgi:Rv2525c-like, glycoside hydrolase-like domain
MCLQSKRILFVLAGVLSCGGGSAFSGQAGTGRGSLGFDRNDYPGAAAMRELRKEFAFAGYWLTPAPGAKTNTWTGRRKEMQALGYGFLLLARGRPGNAIRTTPQAEKIGLTDAREAARSAKAQGFLSGGIIFIDIEDGGRLTPEYHAYLRAWADELAKQGFRPGAYCSGMAVDEGGGVTIVTADDIRTNAAPRSFVYWVFNDACPPSPGCVSASNPPLPSASGEKDAAVWQFVRSPRVKETAVKCSGYAADENCYAAADAAKKWHLDMNVAASSNPSFQ